MKDQVRELAEYRISQAEETLEVAKELQAGGHYRDAVNRAYYAMFYCGLGLLATRELGSSKHSGVLSLFSLHFVKTGIFSKESGRYLREAFELRQQCDYREFVEIEPEQVNEVCEHAEKFILESRELLTRLN